MKYYTTLLLLMISMHLNAQNKLRKGAKGRLTFDRHQIDPNEMTQNAGSAETYHYTFHYKNTSQETILFTRCQCPCGCYVIKDFPKEKINPGDEGEITVTFWYQKGAINKSVFLHTTIEDPTSETGFKMYEFKVVGEFKK